MHSAIKIFLLIGLDFYQVHSLEPMEVHFWLYTNENRGFDRSCFELLEQSGWKGYSGSVTATEELRKTSKYDWSVNIQNMDHTFMSIRLKNNIFLMFWRKLSEWMIEFLLRATLSPKDYEDKILSPDFNPKYIFIKPETLCHTDSRWEIKIHESKAKYVSFRLLPKIYFK